MLPTKKQTQWENRIKEFGMTYAQYETKYLKNKKKKKGARESKVGDDKDKKKEGEDKVSEHQ